jgi:predicted alpha/beta-fold hydrolase
MPALLNAIATARVDLAAAAERVRRDPFVAPRWLAAPHVQTVLASALPRVVALSPPEQDLLVTSASDTRLRVQIHFARSPSSETALLVVHGLAGSSASGHVLDFARHALRRGLHVVRMNMRNCGGTEHLTPTLYHGNLYQDIHAVAAAAVALPRVRKLVLAGYSMGGNLVLNALAAWGAQAPREIVGAAVVCPTVDVGRSVALVDGPGCAVYRRHYLAALARLVRRKAALERKRAPLDRLARVTTMRAFDQTFSAPSAGFADVDAFYHWVSSGPRLERVAVPTLILHAKDDPVVDISGETRATLRDHPAIALVESSHGGHCGFLEWPSARRRDGRWAPDHVARFAASCAGGAAS